MGSLSRDWKHKDGNEIILRLMGRELFALKTWIQAEVGLGNQTASYQEFLSRSAEANEVGHARFGDA